jgi:hypothetical protein
MAYTIRGKRVAFDNIAAGSVAGRERTITGVSTSARAAVSGYVERLRTSDGTSAGSGMGAEITLRTVSGNQVSDRTTDLGH